jgi:pimeloyl-ACP methyl ester carboxylesterase
VPNRLARERIESAPRPSVSTIARAIAWSCARENFAGLPIPLDEPPPDRFKYSVPKTWRRAVTKTERISEQVTFPSGGEHCAAWITIPEGSGPHPIVVLVHGGGAVHDMKLPEYELAFARAGLAVLAFDYRHFGNSGGQPRQLLSVRRQLADIDAAIAFVRTVPGIDPSRIALWGTSFGASHVLTAAARHPELAAAVVQCPIVRGRAPALASGWRALVRLTCPIVSDLVRAATRRRRCYVHIAGRPGELAFVTAPGAYEGWHSLVATPTTFENRVTASSGIGVVLYNAFRHADRIRCPLLVCVSDQEELMDPALAVSVGERAPRGEIIHYPGGHFDVYFTPLFDRLVDDQVSFLHRHL